ncbi:MAG: hypothetical protein H6Q14_909 [Bacteroidetes bacterium]|nr:hypothetical protein [Bacteroidota bacterium]
MIHSMKIWCGLFPSLLLFFHTTLPAQTMKLNLERSIEIASDSSLQAYINKNRYMSSYWEYKSYKAARLPSVTLTMTPLEYNRDFVQRYNSELNVDEYKPLESLYSYGNLSVSQNFDPTGGTFYVNSSLSRYQSYGAYSYTQFNAVPVQVGYSQSLFGFNSFKWQKKIEPLKLDKAQKQFLYSREQISETVIGYFFAMVSAKLEYDMARETVSSSDTLYRLGQKRQEIASISQSDLLTLKLEAVNAVNSLRNAETSYQKAEFSLIQYLNLSNGTALELEMPQLPGTILISVDEALEHARENNPDYLDYKRQLLESQRDLEQTKKSSNFSATLSLSIGYNQVADRFSDSYKSPLQQEIASFSVSIPLLDWGVRKGKVNMAVNNLNVTRLSVKQEEQKLEQDVIMTVKDFNIQQSLVTSSKEAVELATLAFRTTRERFIIGKADLNSLTLALNRQNTAQRNYVSSLQSYWLSYYKLRRLTLFDFLQGKHLLVDFGSLAKYKNN